MKNRCLVGRNKLYIAVRISQSGFLVANDRKPDSNYVKQKLRILVLIFELVIHSHDPKFKR